MIISLCDAFSDILRKIAPEGIDPVFEKQFIDAPWYHRDIPEAVSKARAVIDVVRSAVSADEPVSKIKINKKNALSAYRFFDRVSFYDLPIDYDFDDNSFVVPQVLFKSALVNAAQYAFDKTLAARCMKKAAEGGSRGAFFAVYTFGNEYSVRHHWECTKLFDLLERFGCFVKTQPITAFEIQTSDKDGRVFTVYSFCTKERSFADGVAKLRADIIAEALFKKEV